MTGAGEAGEVTSGSVPRALCAARERNDDRRELECGTCRCGQVFSPFPIHDPAARLTLGLMLLTIIVLDSVGVGELPDAARLWRRRFPHPQPHPEAAPVPCPIWRDWDWVAFPPSTLAPRPFPTARRYTGFGPDARGQPRQGHLHRPLGIHGRAARTRLPDLPRRLSARRDGRLRRRHRARAPVQQAVQRHRRDPRLRRGAPADRQSHRVHQRRQRVPDRRPRRRGAAGNAVRMVRRGPRPVAGASTRWPA